MNKYILSPTLMQSTPCNTFNSTKKNKDYKNNRLIKEYSKNKKDMKEVRCEYLMKYLSSPNQPLQSPLVYPNHPSVHECE